MTTWHITSNREESGDALANDRVLAILSRIQVCCNTTRIDARLDPPVDQEKTVDGPQKEFRAQRRKKTSQRRPEGALESSSPKIVRK